jgi:hypothetical protein
MPFDFAQESVRQACPELRRRAHHERNQQLAVRPELVEGLVQRFSKVTHGGLRQSLFEFSAGAVCTIIQQNL